MRREQEQVKRNSRFFESEEKPLKESRSSRHIQMIAPNLIIPYAVMPRSSEDFFSMERLLIHCGKLPTVTVFNPIKYRLSYFTFFAEPKKNMVLESLFSFGIYPSCFFCKIGMGGSASICCHISEILGLDHQGWRLLQHVLSGRYRYFSRLSTRLNGETRRKLPRAVFWCKKLF